MSSELTLLIALVIGIELSMPVGTYLLFSGRHDDKTRLWLASVCLASTGMILVALRPFVHTYLGHQLPWMLVIPAFLLMIEAIRRETMPKSSWTLWWALVFIWALSVNVLYFMGYTESWGIAAYRTLVFVLCLILWRMIRKLQSIYASKSLVLLQIGILLYCLPPLIGMAAFLLTSSSDVMNVYKFSIYSNIVVFGFIIAVLFISWGYWGFTLEKSQRERNVARAEQVRAEDTAEEMRKLVQERDRLLVMNSRFSVVSALSSFSAMLVHDITQPLQTLQLGLDRIRANLAKGLDADKIQKDLSHLEDSTEKAGALVAALRVLMQSGESRVSPVPLFPLFAQIEAILNSEALQNRVQIRLNRQFSEDVQVWADQLMLQRIVINLVANCLHHFQSVMIGSPQVEVDLVGDARDGVPGVTIMVRDNGGGFPEALLQNVGQPWTSQRPNGMGMGLMLSKQIVAIWGGSLELFNRKDGVAGATVLIWLRGAT